MPPKPALVITPVPERSSSVEPSEAVLPWPSESLPSLLLLKKSSSLRSLSDALLLSPPTPMSSIATLPDELDSSSASKVAPADHSSSSVALPLKRTRVEDWSLSAWKRRDSRPSLA